MSDERDDDGSASAEVGRLIEGAVAGDPSATEELYRRYRPYLAVLASPRIPRELRGRFDTEDVLQSAFLTAFMGLKNYKYVDEERFKGWLREITMTKLLDRLRKHGRVCRSAYDTLSDSHLDERPGEKTDDQSPTAILTKAERYEELLGAIQGLPLAERQAIVMRCFERRTFTQIAEELGWSEDAARRRYLDALETLLRRLR